MTKLRILSGMRPTGKMHLGHLVGALENWVQLQDDYDCFYMVADWHALMSEYQNDTYLIRKYAYDNVIDWISAGIDPKRSTVFMQSDVPEHVELHMILSTITPIGWLERCPTYKEQMVELKDKDLSTYAFLGYPVLQASDILLYKANLVPVGEDQIPHLELTREIARRLNYLFSVKNNNPPLVPEPEAKLTRFPRLLGLDRRKMSKSYENAIHLSDSPQEIAAKVQMMFTDPSRLKKTDPGHPAECNVYAYYKVFADRLTDTLSQDCHQAKIGCTDCKKNLADLLINIVKPIRDKRAEIEKDSHYIKKVLSLGAEKAREVAGKTISEIHKAVFG
ncbi:MAG: tryptophan--tRNA ligase [Planctomycetota bacterium]|nr:tryptophan--tRNA ligase [Planctomycetota bacterium]MDI6788505.1 tryptophan--tRNA ligase [Planctomycetota bacterium]